MSLAENPRAASISATARDLYQAGRGALRASAAVLCLVGAGILAGQLGARSIGDDPAFAPQRVTEGGLRSVDMAVALIEREIDDTSWVANDPVFLPGAWLPNMGHYQQGLIYGLSRFASELADSLGRTRGSTAVDPDLDRAAGLLRFPGDVWVFDFEKSFAPVVASESQYRAAARALGRFNGRLAAQGALFDPRPDNLRATLARIETDISSKINILAEHVDEVEGGVARADSNEVFYMTKGALYAYLMVFKGLEHDFSEVIRRENLSVAWSGMMESFGRAVALRPALVKNSAPGSLFAPSHVAELGFYALRAKTQLRDVMVVIQG